MDSSCEKRIFKRIFIGVLLIETAEKGVD